MALTLLQKLLEIRKSVEYIQKTERGNQGAMYVDPAVLVKKIRDKMDDHNILLLPSLKNSSVESIPDPTKANPNASSFLFKSEMVYTFLDCEGTDKIDVPWFMTGKHLQDPAMAGGAALTYFERYFMLKFFQIPTAKDDPEYFKNKTKDPEPPSFLEIMKWYAKHEPKLYKETLEHWQIDSAKKVVNPESQEEIVKHLEEKAGYNR